MPADERILTRLSIENRTSNDIQKEYNEQPVFICDASRADINQTGIVITADRMQVIHNGQVQKELLKKYNRDEYNRILESMVSTFEEPVIMTEEEHRSDRAQDIARNSIPAYKNETDSDDSIKKYRERIFVEKENIDVPEVRERYENIERNTYHPGEEDGRKWEREQIDRQQKKMWNSITSFRSSLSKTFLTESGTISSSNEDSLSGLFYKKLKTLLKKL